MAILQQVLFYRERGFELKKIKEIIYKRDFDIVNAMEEHLMELEKQKAHTELLIQTVKKTIKFMKGECDMNNHEKFQAFKEKMVRDNEAAYGEEARRKYGDEEVISSNQKMLNMSEEELKLFQNMEVEILSSLENAVKNGVEIASEEAKEIAELHKKWLSMVWRKYDTQAHKGVAAMYIADERFTKYYDRNMQGCAEFLNNAVQFWVE